PSIVSDFRAIRDCVRSLSGNAIRLPVCAADWGSDLLLRFGRTHAEVSRSEHDGDRARVPSTFVAPPTFDDQGSLAHQRRFRKQCVSTTISFNSVTRTGSTNAFRLCSCVLDCDGFGKVDEREPEGDAETVS